MQISFGDILSQIADSGWGKDFKNSDEAQRQIIADKPSLTAFAGVELLRRLNAIARAAGPSEGSPFRNRIDDDGEAVSLPDVSIGDRLYEYAPSSEGLYEFIVVAKDEQHRCIIVRTGDFDLKYGPTIRLADKDARTTKKEAIKDGMQQYLKWYEKEVEFCKQALKAADENADMSEFESGFPEGE